MTHWYNSGTKLVEIANFYVLGFKANSMRQNPHLTLLGWPRTWDWVDRDPGENQILLFY